MIFNFLKDTRYKRIIIIILFICLTAVVFSLTIGHFTNRQESPGNIVITPPAAGETKLIFHTDPYLSPTPKPQETYIKGNFQMEDHANEFNMTGEDISYVSMESNKDNQSYELILNLTESGKNKLYENTKNLSEDEKNNLSAAFSIDNITLMNVHFYKIIEYNTIAITDIHFSSDYVQHLCDRINTNEGSYSSFEENLLDKIVAENFRDKNYNNNALYLYENKKPASDAEILFYLVVLEGGEQFPILAVNKPDSIEYLILSNECINSADNKILFQNIDNDGLEDIIVHFENAGRKESWRGVYESFVYRYDTFGKNFINIPFDDSSFNAPDNRFSLRILDEFTCNIKKGVYNKEGIYDIDINLNKRPLHFKAGTILPICTAPCDSIYPVDIDNDGVYEIITEQVCYYFDGASTDYLGRFYKIWQHDKSSDTLKVIKSGFWSPYMEKDISSYENDEEREKYFSENWYK